MEYKLLFIKLGRFAQVICRNAKTDVDEQTLYVSASDINVDYNIYTNQVTVNVNAVRSFQSIPIGDSTGVYFDNDNSGSFVAVDSKTSFDTAFALLFPDEGGGSPTTTPNLQQVTDEGNATTNTIISASGAGLHSAQLRYTNPFAPNPGKKTGIIDLINEDGNVTSIINNLSEGAIQQYYRLPDKAGVIDTFAMLTDLPVSGPYAAAITNAVNCSPVRNFTRYTINYNVFKTAIVSFSFNINAAALGLCSFEIQMPFNVSPSTAACAGSFTAAATAATPGINQFLAGSISNGTASDRALFRYEEQVLISRVITGTLIYTNI